ncbi:MAG: hypothetical protein ABR511_09775 [Acidimicrobiales bacterium]
MLRSRVLIVFLALGMALAWAMVLPAAAQTGPGSAPAGLPGPHDQAAAAEAGRQAVASQSPSAPRSGVAAQAAPSGGSLVTYRVFATQYAPHTAGSVEVAVPDQCVKFAALGNTTALAQVGCPAGYGLGLDYRVSVSRDSGQRATIPVKEVGPWNVDDNYWDGGAGSPRPRRLFTDLPRGTPEAQAAFTSHYNTRANCSDLTFQPTTQTAGADQYGRCVLNPAGIDLSFAAAASLGLAAGQNEWVNVTFLWETSGPGSKPAVARQAVRYLRQSTTTGAADFFYRYGNTGDTPLMGDWDGNGTRTPAVFRAGNWYLSNSNTTGVADVAFSYGDAGDIPVVGDWNGDGIETPGVVRGGTWYLRNSNTTGVADVVFSYGDAGDHPVVGDWNADGVDTPGVVRGGGWYLRNSNTTGVADIAFGFGNSTDVPVVGDWNADGVDTPGVFRGGGWYLRNTNATGTADVFFAFGDTGDIPLVWR